MKHEIVECVGVCAQSTRTGTLCSLGNCKLKRAVVVVPKPIKVKKRVKQ